MDNRRQSISPHDFYNRFGFGAAPIVIDVRRDADFAGDNTRMVDTRASFGAVNTGRFP
jgi:hypothetical protein